ncbi:M48 family metallopeptidase [Rufibacter ruber]|uniref:M48 family metallopeptidase n=1 Tax=Rufibacter ruber TaxID=1783499 RepID=UPI00082E1A38|nr:M48 family metallopeptidase [Rufibacter ruber]
MPVEVTPEPEGLKLEFEANRQPALFWPAPQLHPHAYRKADLTVLRFGQEPVLALEVVSPTFAEHIRQAYPAAVFHRNALPAAKPNRSALYLLLLLLIGGLLACYFFVLPALADWAVRQLPPEAEVKLGQQLYAQTVDPNDVDTARTKEVNRFLQELRVVTQYPLQVTVVNQETVNAFALPGGQLVVYTGLLNRLESPEELAALLGHEFAHSQHRHTLRALARSLSTYLLVSLLFNDISGLAALLLENADQLDSLQYSRSLEEEADEQGFLLLKANRLAPQGMQRLFQRLQEAVPAGAEPPALLSTHPLTADRLAHLQELMKRHPYQPAPAPALQQIWARLDTATQ